MSILRIEGLSAEAAAVQESSIARVKASLDDLVAEYRKRFGVHVSTDNARELFPDYTASLDSRLKFAPAVQRSAAAVGDAVFTNILEESNGGSILFTAGGTGAGKTVSISNSLAKASYQSANLIYDSNFNSYESSKGKVESALNVGCKVVVIFIHRHPVEAYLQGVLRRALEQGRTVSIEGHLRMHRDARKTFLKMDKSFPNNNNISFKVLSNTGHESETFPADIDYLRAVQYDEQALGKAIKEGLDCAFQEQRISQTLYEASCGSPRP